MNVLIAGCKRLLAQYHQGEIVTRIETERAIVHGNRELIRFASREEKVKKVIPARGQCERVWEG